MQFRTMHFDPKKKAKFCCCFLDKKQHLHHFIIGEDAIGNKWRAIADDFGSIVYVEIKPAKRLHFNAYERD